MSKTNKKRTVSKTKPAKGGRPTGEGTNHRTRRRGWSGWAISIAIGVIAGSVIAWWMWTSRTGTEEASAAQPIATISAPDFHSLLIDPGNPDRVLFGSHEGTQESRDGGVTWQPGGLRGADAMILASSPKASETIYAAGHDVFQVSRDGGATWQPVIHDLPGTDIHGFAQSPEDPLRLYAFVVGAGCFTSTDGGVTWGPFMTQPPGGSYTVLASGGNVLYAATDAGIARSGDHGKTWVSLESQPGQVTVLSLAVAAANPDIIYVGTPGGAFRTSDGGESWRAIGPTGVAVLSIAVASDSPEEVLVLADQGAVYRSADAGASWHDIDE